MSGRAECADINEKDPQGRQARSAQAPASSRRLRVERVLVIYLAAALGVLVLLRATVDQLDFLGIGWLVVLAVIPLAPLLLPRIADLAKALSPHVSSFKVGAVQFDLRDVRRDPITVVAAGVLAAVPNDMFPFQVTGLDMLMHDLERLRREGGAPVVVIDLRDGTKWRQSNLYLFARLLDQERVAQLVFTELRGGRDGYLVGTCPPADVVRQMERALPEYSNAAASLGQPQPAPAGVATPTDAQQQVAMLSPILQPNDHVYLHAAYVAELLGPLLSTVAVDGIADMLGEDDLRTIVRARLRFIPAISNGRVIDIIDQDSVALAVARAALAQ